jgi:hypothetical protein
MCYAQQNSLSTLGDIGVWFCSLVQYVWTLEQLLLRILLLRLQVPGQAVHSSDRTVFGCLHIGSD